MKRIAIIILSVATIIAGNVSCQKVNDIDKRLTELEQTVSDLKAQILAGAVITTVDKTDDGCTFTLSNGQSYTVTNGKNGTDGEAIIADVKIEEDFVVLTLKNGETLRISYQNPLSMVTLSIVPDYDDGTVQEPKTLEAMGTKSHNFYLNISVTPAKYAEILSDTERFIHKAVFSPVRTKSDFGRAFTVSPKRVTYAAGAPIPFLEAYFGLDDETAEVLMNKNTPYTVSFSIEDKDGVHGAATAFVTISHEKGSGPDAPSDGIIPEGALPGVFSVSSGNRVYFSKGNLMATYHSSTGKYTYGFAENQSDYIDNSDPYMTINNQTDGAKIDLFSRSVPSTNYGIILSININDFHGDFVDWGTAIDDKGTWRTLSQDEWHYLIDKRRIDGKNGYGNTCVYTTINSVNGLLIFCDNYSGEKTGFSEIPQGCVFLPAVGGRYYFYNIIGSGNSVNIGHAHHQTRMVMRIHLLS